MKKRLMSMLALLVGGACFAIAPPADFYVSPTGSDAAEGTISSPFATLERARDAVRVLKKKKSGDITVLLRGGIYPLNKTVVFGLADSGEGTAMVTYGAYPGETPVFSSGRTIKGWEKVTGPIPGLPAAAQGNVWVAPVSDRFFSLYNVDGLLPRARSAGFIPLHGSGRDRLHFPAGLMKNVSNVTDVEILVRPHHAWMMNILPVVSLDEQKRIARTSIESTYIMDELEFLKGDDSCWIENVLDALDKPGEWVLNTKEGKLYLWPSSKSSVVAPSLIEYIRVEGQIDEQGPTDIPVRNLCFRGLTFMHGARDTLTPEDKGLQHDWEMHDKATALVRFRGTENCAIKQCHFANSGAGAIRVDLYGQNNVIEGNHIEHIGGTGILLCGYGPGTKDVSHHNVVYNNHIHHTGELYWHAPGIMVWQSGENRVANNLIHNVPYAGIIVSGCMTEFFVKGGKRELTGTLRKHEIKRMPKKPEWEDVLPYLHSHDNFIEYNEIHHAMEMLGDGNAIYIRGSGAGNVIRRNYIHHLITPIALQAAIRTDGGQRDTLVAENVIYKCMSQGIKLKLNNRAENNFIIDLLEATHKGETVEPRYLALLEGPMTGGSIKRNILYHSGKDAKFFYQGSKSRGRNAALAKDADTDYNIYYCGKDPKMASKTLNKAQKDGIDLHSQAVDPLFVDPANGDFRFKPGSPALKMGILPIDLSKIGLRTTME
jgi:hypothetical protein